MHLQPTGGQGATLAPLFLHNQPTNFCFRLTKHSPTTSTSDQPAQFQIVGQTSRWWASDLNENSREQRRNSMDKSIARWTKWKGNQRGGRQGRKEEQSITKSREQRIGEQSLPRFWLQIRCSTSQGWRLNPAPLLYIYNAWTLNSQSFWFDIAIYFTTYYKSNSTERGYLLRRKLLLWESIESGQLAEINWRHTTASVPMCGQILAQLKVHLHPHHRLEDKLRGVNSQLGF